MLLKREWSVDESTTCNIQPPAAVSGFATEHEQWRDNGDAFDPWRFNHQHWHNMQPFQSVIGTSLTSVSSTLAFNKGLNTRMITVTSPAPNNVMVCAAQTQTLTNKTLTSPTLNSSTLSGTFSSAFTTSRLQTASDRIRFGTSMLSSYEEATITPGFTNGGFTSGGVSVRTVRNGS